MNIKRFAFRLSIVAVTFSLGASAAWMFVHRPRSQGREFAPQTWSITVPDAPMKFHVIKLADAPAPIGEDDSVSLQFATENDGWLSINGRLWRTDNGGRNWEQVRLPRSKSNNQARFITTQYLNPNVGWITTDSGLFRTNDSGRTWRLLKRSTGVGTDNMNRIDSFSFAKDGMHGWIIESRYRPLLANEVRGAPHSNYSSGGNHILSSFIKFTQDGGVSWKAQTIKPTWNSLDSITAIDSTHAIAYGIAGVYFLDGNQWKPAESVSDGENSTSSCLDAACGSGCRIPTTIQFVDSQTGWIANTNGYVGRSMDGGKTWSDISRDLWQGYVDHMYGVQVQFVDHYSGWGINGNGWLVTSQDGGTSWHIVNDNRWYAGMFFLDSKHGWAVSNDGIFKIAEDHRPN